MTPGQAAKAIEKALAQSGTKADKARLLFALGLEKTEVAELIPMNYSQARSIWLAEGYTDVPRVRAAAGVHRLREVDASDSQQRRSNRRELHLTPTQIRYATQDGHEVVRVDRQTGAECYNCGARVQFSLRHLAFVHTFSKEEPTDLEDRYE